MYNENFEYIISNFKNGKEPFFGTIQVNGNNINKSILRPLLKAMTDEDAEKLRMMCGNDEGLKYRIDHRNDGFVSDVKTFERNESVDTLIDWLKTRKGLASVIKRELKRRFDYMNWDEQVRVIRLFLFKAKTDREWCYKRMRRWWNDAVTEDLMACWKKYHDELAAEIVVRYAPMDFVMQNESELARLSPTELCLRTSRLEYLDEKLNWVKDFREYIYVISKLKPQLSYEKQRNLLYRVAAIDLFYFTYNLYSNPGDAYQFYGNLTSFLISAFGKMGCADIIMEYEKWRNDCLRVADNIISLKNWSEEERVCICKNAIRFKTFIMNMPIVSDCIRVMYDVLTGNVKFEDFKVGYEKLTHMEKYQLYILKSLNDIDLVIKDIYPIDVLGELGVFNAHIEDIEYYRIYNDEEWNVF